MKVIWEDKDVKSGRRYRKPGTGETWMIGYIQKPQAKVVTSVSMADGSVVGQYTKKEMAVMLTASGYVPEEMIDSEYFMDDRQRVFQGMTKQ